MTTIAEVCRHAHASEVACARSLSALLNEAHMRRMRLLLDGERRATVESIEGGVVLLMVDGHPEMMPALAIADMLGDDGPAVVGRWCQRVLNGDPLSVIVYAYPEFFTPG